MTESMPHQDPPPQESGGGNRKNRDKQSNSFAALKQRIRQRETELNQCKVKEKAIIERHERDVSLIARLKNEIQRMSTANEQLTRSLNTVLTEKKESLREIERLRHIEKELTGLKQRLSHQAEGGQGSAPAKSGDAEIVSLEGSMRSNGDQDRLVSEILSRMDGFIDGGLREHEELVRQVDRIRDRAVQSIRNLEKEKAINLGLLRSKEVNRTFHERVGIFVDVQNMFYAARQQFNGRLDFQRLLTLSSNNRRVSRAIAYIIQTPDIDQSNFISLLTRSGYEVKSKELRTRIDGSAKGNWDMEMAMDIISFLPKLDVVALVSGDGDFVPLVQKIKSEYNVRCEVFGFEHNTAVDLKEIADVFHPIGRDLILESSIDRVNDHDNASTAKT